MWNQLQKTLYQILYIAYSVFQTSHKNDITVLVKNDGHLTIE